eukprot:Colp12_sorted_trinity150504_noHs@2486
MGVDVGSPGISSVPVIDIHVVGGVSVTVAEAGLEELVAGGAVGGERVEVSARGEGDQHVLAEVRHQVHVLTDEAVRVDLPAQRGGRLVGEERGAVAVEELVDGDLLEVARIAVEGQRVLGVHVHGGVHDGVHAGQLGVGGAGDDAVEGGQRGLVAAHGVLGDGAVGQVLEGGGHGGAVGVPVQGSGVPVLAVRVVEHERVVAGQVLVRGGGEELIREVGEADVLRVVVVQRVGAPLAHALRAVAARVAGVTHAAHGGFLVPQLVDVAEVASGDLLDGLAGAVARAHAIGVTGATGSLAGRSVVALEARARAGLAVAHALVGALSVLVGGVGNHIAIQINGGRVLLGGAEGIHGIVGNMYSALI